MFLTRIPSCEEIKSAVFKMNNEGAPGPNGFGGCFYQAFWDIISQDVCKSVSQFFAQNWLLPNLNSNLVVPIPKVQNADKIEDYRPITLANFQFKIITRVLADKLSHIAPKIISPWQRGFIKGRNIKECICIASENANLIDYKAFGGNLALKLDIRKAFDTLDWNFLISVLDAFGFNNIFCNWTKTVLQLAKLSFLVNGKTEGFFACKRGVRQGDPLSLLLFCMAEDVLSRGISHLVDSGLLHTVSGPKNLKSPSHMLYANDVLVFCKGNKTGLDALMHLFQEYGSASSQYLTPSKCRFYSSSISVVKSSRIANALGFSASSLPFSYLGVSIFKGKPRRSHLQPITDRILSKFSYWKGSILSLMGRVKLVKPVIQIMLLYNFQVYLWPYSLLKVLDKKIRNFIWSGDPNVKKICTVSGNKLCRPALEGGLGVKSLKNLNEAALLKLTFEMMASNTEWASFLRCRFLHHRKPAVNYVKSSLWPGIKVNMQTVLSNSI